VPRCFEARAKESAGRTFAVCPGNMKNRWKFPMRVPETHHKFRDSLKAQHIAARRKHRQPVQLFLDGGIIACCVISHA